MTTNNTLFVGPLSIKRDTDFGGIYICISIEEFLSLGFNYGDSVNISFSGGLEFKDVPFYSGYYVGYNELLLVGYQNYPYVLLKYNFKNDFIEKTGLTLDQTAIITINEKEKNILIQELFEQKHSNDRNDYMSDESFCNFREITKNNLVYRSASPCSNNYNRPHCVSKLLEKYKINYVLDLSNSKAKMHGYYMDKNVDNKHWKNMYEKGNAIAMPLDVNYKSKECAKTIIEMLRFMLNSKGPFLIHCAEGKDRTGFAGIIIGALANNTIEEIETDYMKTYDEYYHITKKEKSKSYNAIKELYLDRMIKYLCNDKSIEDITSECIQRSVIKYLFNNGMNEEEITKLQEKLK